MLQFYLLIRVALSQLTMTTAEVGCYKSSGGVCTQLCQLGIQICEVDGSAISCEYGYFMFQKVCVAWYQFIQPSPYYGLSDPLTLYCMDCVENPYTWYLNRKCTYDYQLLGSDVVYGTFVKRAKSYSELYFIGAAISDGVQTGALKRDLSQTYSVFICSGCLEFCSASNTDCNQVSQSYIGDTDKYGVTCLSSYYFQNNYCVTCPTNCITCTNSICSLCQSGYFIQGNTCGACSSQCSNCQDNKVCYQCISPYVAALDGSSCVSCASACLSCEYTYYGADNDQSRYPTRVQDIMGEDVSQDIKNQYILRCRQCDNGYFLSSDGVNCVQCQVRNCNTCYYKFSSGVTTMDLDFTPASAGDAPQLNCLECSTGYSVDPTGKMCIPNTVTIPNCQSITNGKCFRCSYDYILDLSLYPTVGSCYGSCSAMLSNCINCYAYTDSDAKYYINNANQNITATGQLEFQCTLCKSGYYPDYFTGSCLGCPSGCSLCSQYSTSFNFTQYIQLEQPTVNISSKTTKQKYLSYTIKIFCSKCTTGYNLYGNECLGCTNDCQVTNPSSTGIANQLTSACVFKSTFAFCGNCFVPSDRSLVDDYSHCIKCPQYCLGCRSRTTILNPYFNPANSDLLPYGNLCYMYQQSAGTLQTTYDTILGIPVTCSNQVTAKCINTAKATISLYCDSSEYKIAYLAASASAKNYIYDLQSFYEIQSQTTATVTFDQFETLSQYLTFNQYGYSQLEMTINLISSSGTCNFTKDTLIQTQFHVNVHSLTNFTVIFTSPRLLTIISNKIIFTNYNSLTISNMIFTQYPNSIAYGLIVNKTSLLYLNTLQFTGSTSLLVNCQVTNLSIISVLFDQTTTNTLYFTPLHTVISSLKFSNSYFYNQVLFTGSLYAVDVQFTQCNMTAFTFFKDYNSLNLVMSRLFLTFCIIYQSTFLDISMVNGISLAYIDIVRSTLNQSQLLSGPSFIIDSVYVNNSIINGSLFITQDALKNSTVDKYFTFNNIYFNSTRCHLNCLMKISTPFNTWSMVFSVQISNLYVNFITTTGLSTLQRVTVTSALIHITQVSDVTLYNIQIDNTQGISILYFDDIYSLDVNTFSYDWSYPVIGPLGYDPMNSTYLTTIVPYMINNKIPDSSCQNGKTATLGYNMYALYVSRFLFAIRIQNLAIKQLLLIDSSSIFIQSYDTVQNTTASIARPIGKFYSDFVNEYILINNANIFNSSLFITDNTKSFAFLVISSQQKQEITITNIQLIGSHIQQTLAYTDYPSTVILINSPQANVLIQYLTAFQNRAVSSNHGIIYIISYKLTLDQVIFNETNVVKSFWADRYEQVELSFTISSDGANVFAEVQYFIFTNSIVYNTVAYEGSIKVKGQSSLDYTITNVNISDQYGANVPQMNGGALFIDGTTCEINVKISYLYMTNCVSRQYGGCLFFDVNDNVGKIVITHSTFNKCAALLTSFLDAQFKKAGSELTLYNVTVSDNAYSSLFNNVDTITSAEIYSFTQSSSVINFKYGNLNITQCKFKNILFTSIINAKNLDTCLIKDTSFTNNVIYNMQLIILDHNITLDNLVIYNTTQYNIYTNDQYNYLYPSGCYNYKLVSIDSQVDCTLIYSIIKLQTQIASYYSTTQMIFDSVISMNYASLISKYAMPTYDITSFVPVQVIQPIQITTQPYNWTSQDLCYLTYIVNTYSFSTSISLVYIVATSLKLNSVSLENNQCLRCLGGIIQIIASDINIQELNCNSNTMGYYGCIYASNSLINVSTSYPLTGTRLLATSPIMYLNNSLFSSNTAVAGAGATIIELNAQISQTTFVNNIASQMGGAIVYQAVTHSLTLYNLSLSNNYAQIGAGIFSNQQLPNATINQLSMTDNHATQTTSPNEQTPTALSLQMMAQTCFSTLSYTSDNYTYNGDYNGDGYIDNTTVAIIDQVQISYQILGSETPYLQLPSGQAISTYKYYFSYTEEQIPFNWLFRIVNLNSNKQILTQGQSSQSCSIAARIQNSSAYDNSKAFLQNFTNVQSMDFNSTTGSYNMDSLIIYFDPYMDPELYLQLRFQCSSVQIPVISPTTNTTIGVNTNYYLFVNVQTFQCQLGEAYQSQSCVACGKSTYSVQVKQTQCSAFDTNSMSDVTPIAIKLLEGYWRAESSSSKIEECTNLLTNCNGGWIPGDSSCFTGHSGGNCEGCDIYGLRGDGQYSISKKYTCGSCAGTVATNSLTITAISIFTLVSMIMSVKGNYQMLEHYIHSQVLQSMGIRINKSEDNLSILIKLLTGYLQIIRALTQFKISMPSAFTSSMDVLGNPTETMSYSLDCFLVDMTTVDIVYFRIIWTLVMPALYIMLFFLGWFFGIIIGQFKFKLGVIYTAFIYMFIYLQPTLIGGFIGLASQRQLGGIYFVQADVNYRYNTTTHGFWLIAFVLPMLLTWSILLPLLFLDRVKSVQHSLNDNLSRMKWGYFYNEYTPGAYLWEFVKIFEKQFVIIALAYYQDLIVVKGLLIFLIIFFYGAFTFRFTPYTSKRLNAIDQLSTSVCGASLCLGVLIYSCQGENLNYLQYIMFVLIIFINSIFLLVVFYSMFEGYLDKFQVFFIYIQEHVDKLRDKIKARYPMLEFKYPFLRRFLINRSQLNKKAKDLWSYLRYMTRQGIRKRREDKSHPLFPEQSYIEYNDDGKITKQPKMFLHFMTDNKSQHSPQDQDSVRNSQVLVGSGAVSPGQVLLEKNAKVHPIISDDDELKIKLTAPKQSVNYKKDRI